MFLQDERNWICFKLISATFYKFKCSSQIHVTPDTALARSLYQPWHSDIRACQSNETNRHEIEVKSQ